MDLEEKLREARNTFVRRTAPLFSGDSELERLVSKNVYEAFSSANRPAVLHCLSLYADAEIDTRGPSNRGIGRLDESIPRYGAYFRKHLSKLDPAGLETFRQLIFNNAAAGYFAHVALVEDVVRASTSANGERLFQDWIPIIYSSTIPATYGAQTMGMIPAVVSHALVVHSGMHMAFGIKKPGLFSADLTDIILHYHAIAGFALRAVETRPQPS
jgi:hypothetical protein